MPEKTAFLSRNSRKTGYEKGIPRPGCPGAEGDTATNSSGCLIGSVFSKTASSKLKMAVFAPIPSASVSTATAVKPGFLSNWRKANLRSFIAQCFHRIYSCRPACRQPAGQQGYGRKQERDSNEGHWIGAA